MVADHFRGTNMSDDLLDQLTERETKKEVKAAVTWVIDVTMSMDKEIVAVREALEEFADIFERRKVRLHLGMISFRDLTQGETITVHEFDGGHFTRSGDAFKGQVQTLSASGGGPRPESSYDAIARACEMDWPQGCEKIIVLVTDAPSHTSTTSKNAAKAALQGADVKQFYALTYTTEAVVRDCYVDFTAVGKGGAMFDLGNRDKSTLIKTIRNLGLTSSERTVSKTTDRETTE